MSVPPMWSALLWGAGSAFTFPAGAALGLKITISHQTTGLLMAFGSGTLIFAVSVELFGELLERIGSGKADYEDVAFEFISALLGASCYMQLNRYLQGWQQRSLAKSSLHTRAVNCISKACLQMAELMSLELTADAPEPQLLELLRALCQIGPKEGATSAGLGGENPDTNQHQDESALYTKSRSWQPTSSSSSAAAPLPPRAPHIPVTSTSAAIQIQPPPHLVQAPMASSPPLSSSAPEGAPSLASIPSDDNLCALKVAAVKAEGKRVSLPNHAHLLPPLHPGSPSPLRGVSSAHPSPTVLNPIFPGAASSFQETYHPYGVAPSQLAQALRTLGFSGDEAEEVEAWLWGICFDDMDFANYEDLLFVIQENLLQMIIDAEEEDDMAEDAAEGNDERRDGAALTNLDMTDTTSVILQHPNVHNHRDHQHNDSSYPQYIIPGRNESERKKLIGGTKEKSRAPSCFARWFPCFVKQSAASRREKLKNDDWLASLGLDSAVMAIWLGVMMDGVPEAVLIGLLAMQHRMSVPFIASIFVSNFPEAVSCAAMSQQRGMKWYNIIIMWAILCVMTGGVAMVTAAYFQHASLGMRTFYHIKEVSEGLSAGAMLTMVVAAMIPEAISAGGDLAGFVLVIGFLTSTAIKIVELMYYDE